MSRAQQRLDLLESELQTVQRAMQTTELSSADFRALATLMDEIYLEMENCQAKIAMQPFTRRSAHRANSKSVAA